VTQHLCEGTIKLSPGDTLACEWIAGHGGSSRSEVTP
jgi:hypothetical protein